MDNLKSPANQPIRIASRSPVEQHQKTCDLKMLLLILACIFGASAIVWFFKTAFYATEINDFFLFVDFSHRWDQGQVPHLDYRTPLGFLTTSLPFLGFKLTGDYALGMNVAAILDLMLCLPVLLYLSTTRLTPAQALIIVLDCIVLVLVPTDLLDNTYFASGGMLYNRFGWAILMLAAIFLMPIADTNKQRPRFQSFDLIALAFLSFLGVFVKITFGVAILAIAMVYVLLNRPSWRALCAGLITGLLLWAAIELKFHLTLAYLADLRYVSSLETVGRFSPMRIFDVIGQNLPDCLLGLVLPIILLAAGGKLRSIHTLLLLFISSIAFVILLENAQNVRLPLLIVTALLAANVLAQNFSSIKIKALCQIIPIAASIPLLDQSTRTLTHTAFLTIKSPQELVNSDIPQLSHLTIRRDGNDTLLANASENKISAQELLRNETPLLATGFQTYRQQNALATYHAALALIPECHLKGGGLLNADFSNPIPALANLKPAGREPLWHEFRSFTKSKFPSPDEVFDHIDCVFIPLQPLNVRSQELFLQIYEKELHQRYPDEMKTPLWTILRKAQ